MKMVSVSIFGIIKNIKMSLKLDMMVEYVKDNNRDWQIMPKKMIIKHLKLNFKCSTYMAQQAVEKLFKDV
jgi:hypothetical protein